jgi:hypothetical protein
MIVPPLMGLYFGLRPLEILSSFSFTAILLMGVSPEKLSRKATASGIRHEAIRAIRRAYNALSK